MKFSVETSSIVTALQRASIGVNRKTPNPLLLNVLLSADARGVKVYGTDMVIGSSARCAGDIKEEGMVAVDQQRLLDILSNMPTGKKVTFAFVQGKLRVSCGKAVYNLLLIDASTFPSQIRPAGTPMEIGRTMLAELIRWTEHAMCSDETRGHLYGARFTMDKKQATMTTTDSRRMAVGCQKHKSKEAFSVFAPYPSVHAIKKFCDSVSQDNVMFSANVTHLFFWTEDVGLSSRLVEVKAMDYSTVIPKTSKTDVSFVRSTMLSALTRLRVMSDDPVRLYCDVDNNKLEITSSSPLAGDGKETIPIGVKGKAIEITLSLGNLYDALSVMSSDHANLFFGGERDPVLAKPRDDSDHTMLFMPIADSS